MEDIRTYRDEEEENRNVADEERELAAAGRGKDDEVPFHIPRD
jgi:hypothetical protein